MSDTKQEEMEKAESELSSVDEDDGGGMPVIERMAWQEEDLKGMPVLQRMVDLPSKNGAQAARSPPPPPLQISLSLKRCSQEGKHSKKNKSGSHRYRVERSVPGMIDDGQGEIEERICPVLTDHEEGSNHVSRWSPGHCICLCRSFPPPTDLISPTATTASTGSSDTKSGKSLVSDNGFCSSLLANVAPESRRFEKVIDDIIGSLQRSEQEENYKDSEELSRLLEKLSLGAENLFRTSEELELMLDRVIIANKFKAAKKLL
nr:hypothetical protein BaRGS_032593 [Batillaria attramentaria]